MDRAAAKPIFTKRALDYLNIIGITPTFDLPFKDHKIKRTVHGILITFVKISVWGYLWMAITFRLYEVYHAGLEKFLDMFTAALNIYGGVLKTLCIQLLMTKLRKANDLFDKLDARCKDPDEVEEQLGAIRMGRRVSLVIMFMYYSFCLSIFAGSVLNGHPTYELPWLVINWKRSSSELYLAVFLELLEAIAVLAQNIFNDGYSAVYILLLTSHVRILKLRVSKLGKGKAEALNANCEALKLCIQDYQDLLGVRNSIATIVSKTIFLQYIIMAMGVSSISITVFLFTPNNLESIRLIVYAVAICAQALPTCYFASLLAAESDDLSTEIFSSAWYQENYEYRRMILGFVHQGQPTMRFTAGLIFEISLDMFIRVAKLAMSLYTFAKTLESKKRQ